MSVLKPLRLEFIKALKIPKVREDIKKLSFIERTHLDELAKILNDVYDPDEYNNHHCDNLQEWNNKQIDKLMYFIETIGGRTEMNKKLLNYGINFDAIMIASGIF